MVTGRSAVKPTGEPLTPLYTSAPLSNHTSAPLSNHTSAPLSNHTSAPLSNQIAENFGAAV